LKPRYDEPMGGRFDGGIAGNVEKVFRDLEASKY
jgi:hypothetical protein